MTRTARRWSLPAALARSFALAVAVASCAAHAPKAGSDTDAVTRRVGELLTRYAANDQDGVLAMLDRSHFTLYGSDASELVRTRLAMRELMTNDFALWKTARFGPIQDLDVFAQDAVATAYFHAPFSAGGQPPLLVRFSTTWHKVDGEWLLVQAANSVPTRGSSAAELTRRR